MINAFTSHDRGNDMSTKPTRTLTPLMRASSIGHLEMVLELLSEGADVNERGPRDSTALMFAAGGGHLDVVKALVQHGADLQAREAGGWTALTHAEEDNDKAIIEYLLRAEQSVKRVANF